MEQWVKDGVAEVARELLRERGGGNHAEFPFRVSMQVKAKHRDIWDHLSRYGSMEPHQYCVMYIPPDVSAKLTNESGDP